MKTKKIISAFLSLAMVLGSSAVLSVHAADTTPDKYYLLQNGEAQNGTNIDKWPHPIEKDETVKDEASGSTASYKWDAKVNTDVPIKANENVDFNEYACIKVRLRGNMNCKFHFYAQPDKSIWANGYQIWKDSNITTDWTTYTFNLSDIAVPYKNNKYIEKLNLTSNGWSISPADGQIIYIDSMWLEKPSKNLDSEYMSGKFKYKYTDDTYTEVEITGYSKSATDADIADVVIPETLDGNTVVSIGDGALRGDNAQKIQSLTIPGTVKTIKSWSFAGCKNLKNVVMKEGIETINSWAFNQTAIEKIVFPASLKDIQNDAFHACNSLKYVDMSKMINLTFIGDRCFYQCESLKEIYFPTFNDDNKRTLAAERMVGGFAGFQTIIAYGSPNSYIRTYKEDTDTYNSAWNWGNNVPAATSGKLLYSFQPIMTPLNTTDNEDGTRNESYTIMLNGSESSKYNSIRMRYNEGGSVKIGAWNLEGETEISGAGMANIGLLIKNLTDSVEIDNVSFSTSAIQ